MADSYVTLGDIVWHCYDEVCYHKSEEAMSWNDARDYCDELGGGSVLASIHSSETNQAIASDLCYDKNCWIGLYGVGNDWEYIDGTSSDYFSWDSGEPNGWNHCVYMYRGNSDKAGLWNDNGCTWVSPDALCMIALPTLTPTDTPSQSPSALPTKSTVHPSKLPSVGPTTMVPSGAPTTLLRATVSPTVSPSVGPTTMVPSLAPTISPTPSPSFGPTTMVPSAAPTISLSPTVSALRTPAPTSNLQKSSFTISFGVMELIIIVCAILIAIILCLCIVRRTFLDLRSSSRDDCKLELEKGDHTQGNLGGEGTQANSCDQKNDIKLNKVTMASGSDL